MFKSGLPLHMVNVIKCIFQTALRMKFIFIDIVMYFIAMTGARSYQPVPWTILVRWIWFMKVTSIALKSADRDPRVTFCVWMILRLKLASTEWLMVVCWYRTMAAATPHTWRRWWIGKFKYSYLFWEEFGLFKNCWLLCWGVSETSGCLIGKWKTTKDCCTD